MNKNRRTFSLNLAFIFVFTLIFSFAGAASVAAEEVPTDGLVAYYSFDNTLNDASTNGNNGTGIGNITFVDAMKDKGAKFDGQSYIEVNSNSSLDLANSFSYSVWVKAYPADDNSRGSYPIFFKKGDENKSAYPYELALDYYNKFIPYNYFNGGSYEARFSTPIDRDKWTMVTVTWDGQSMKYYTDGKFKGTSDFTNGIHQSTGKLYIGNDGKYFYSGIMDELALYNRVLTQSEIGAMYDSVYNASYMKKQENKLVAFYSFDGNLKDSSGFANDGTIVGDGISFMNGIAGSGSAADAVKFNGTGYVEVKDSDSLDIDKEYTLSAWILPTDNPNSPGELSTLLYKVRGMGTSYYWNVEKRHNEDIEQSLGATEIEGRDYFDLRQQVKAKKNNWIFFSLVSDGKNIRYYLNGKPTDIRNDMAGKVVSHSTENLFIGGNIDSKYFYKGLMDELKIYNYALTDKDIAALYNQKNIITVKASASMSVKQSANISVILKPLRGKEIDVTKNCIVLINGKDSKLLKYANGKLIAAGKGKVTFEIRYKNLSVPYTVTIK